ncbi:MAG: hypothetical protein OEY09_02445 [Gammaproteobacteria bacterium]|nr:hypothetical protein [Gammaproteobacteria bacterium]
MSLLLRRSLIFIILLLGGLVLYSLWFGMKADRYDDTAIPYLESAMPRLTSWQYELLEPLLSPTAKLNFKNQEMREAYRLFNRLGQFESMDKPRYEKSYSGVSQALGDVEIVEYQASLEFDTGPAVVKIKLIADGKSYYINHFGFHSEVFSEVNEID